MLWRLLASHMREHKCQMPCRMNVLFVVFAVSVAIVAADVVAFIAVTTLFFSSVLITRMLGIFLRLLQIVATTFFLLLFVGKLHCYWFGGISIFSIFSLNSSGQELKRLKKKTKAPYTSFVWMKLPDDNSLDQYHPIRVKNQNHFDWILMMHQKLEQINRFENQKSTWRAAIKMKNNYF